MAESPHSSAGRAAAYARFLAAADGLGARVDDLSRQLTRSEDKLSVLLAERESDIGPSKR